MSAFYHSMMFNHILKYIIISINYILSRGAGAQPTCQNTKTVDLSERPKRPAKLAEIYFEIYYNEWADAFEDLDVDNDRETVQMLLKILEVNSKRNR